MEDLEFIKRCIKADKNAWNEFVQRYSRLIYGCIHSALKSYGFTFAGEFTNDIFQDIFLSLAKDNCRKLKTYRAKNQCSFSTWLYLVSINHTIDYLRKTHAHASIEAQDEGSPGLKDLLPDCAPNVAQELSFQEDLRQLKDCVGGLELDDRYFLKLHLHKNLSLEELKGHFKISRAAVDMRKSRIMKLLRDCLKRKGFVY
jgi:RNA polymerase sigma factor (sigma-70 family)